VRFSATLGDEPEVDWYLSSDDVLADDAYLMGLEKWRRINKRVKL